MQGFRHALFLAAWPALAAGALAVPGDPPRVLVIGVDGLRPDALAAAHTPALDALISTGAYSADGQCEDLTFSGPNWASILHGVHRDRHNVTTNGYEGNTLAQHPDFLAWLEAHDPTLDTARLVTWSAIQDFQPTGADIALFQNYGSGGDSAVTSWGAQLLLGQHPQHSGVLVDALFVYLADADVAGHAHGFDPSATSYLAEIENVDGQVGVLVQAMQSRPGFAEEDWLIVLTSDHGGSITGSHSGNTPEKRRVPFLVWGGAAVPGPIHPQPRTVDVAKTVLSHMGVPIPASLDGRAVGLAPSGPPVAALDVELVYNGGAELDRGFDGFLPDQYVAGWFDPGPDQFTVIPYDGPSGFPASSDPGPPNRGANFFSGNSTGANRLSQVLDLAPLAGAVDAGQLRYELRAWLGGYASQNDRAEFTAYFLGASGELLGSDTLGPVSAAERGNATGLLLRESLENGVPPLTRSVELVLRAIFAAGGGTDGYADELSFVLRAGHAPPPPRTLVGIPTPGTSEWRFTGDSGALVDVALGPGRLEYADGDGGATDLADQFLVSDGVNIPHIDGQPVSCLHFQSRSSSSEGYVVFSGLETPQDAGHRKFSLVLDLLVTADNVDPWLGVWNGSPTNANDSELFLRPSIEGWWTTDAGTRDGAWKKGEWNRVVFVNDYDGAGTVALFVNGRPTPELEAFATDWVADGLPSPFWLLSDDTPSETSSGYLANLAFVDGLLDEAQVAALGGPRAGGIFPACGLSLAVSPSVAHPGDAVSFTTCGGPPGDPVLLFVTAVNAQPTLAQLSGLGFFDATASWIYDVPQTPAIGPLSVGFSAYTFNFTTGLQASGEVEVGLP